MNEFFEALRNAPFWGEEIIVNREQMICRAGEKDTNLYWITEGCLRVYVWQEETEKTIRFGYENNIIVALDSFIRGGATQFNIQGLRKTAVKKASKKDFMSWVLDDPKREQGWIMGMEELVHQQLEREIDLLTDAPSERFKRVLERSPQLFQEVPFKYIASYLRMTPETLSRIMKS